MDFRKMAAGFAPLAALGLAAMLAGCHHEVRIDGEEGKPLAELDQSGPPPHGLVLLGPDRVQLRHGDKLAISVEGDAAETAQLRFTLKNGTLGILREKGFWGGGSPVTVTVTMPAPDELTMSGSGKIVAGELAPAAKVSIAGSGDVETQALATRRLEVNIAGSGSYRASGKTGDLEVNIAGSGSADMAALHVDAAEVSILGSGGASFASDGKVKASMMGSGSVHVKGRATCEVSKMGSGKLVCQP